MKARIQKWGNSLAVRIPKAVCQQVKLEENTVIELTVDNESIVLSPVTERLTLEEMVALITPKNKHEIVFPDDEPRGNEYW